MIKIVTLFLIVMAGLALFGRLRLPRGPRERLASARCPSCKRFRIGRGPCACGGKS